MINVTWHNSETCENCGQMKPHCAQIDFNLDPDNPEPSPDKLFSPTLCSDCVEDLKRRLS